MKNKLAWVYDLNGVPATIAEHVVHDFNLKRQEMPKLKRKVSCAKMLGKLSIYGYGYITRKVKAKDIAGSGNGESFN